MKQSTAKKLDYIFITIWIVCGVIGMLVPLGVWTVLLFTLPPVLHFATAALYAWSKGINPIKRIRNYFRHV